MNLRSGGDADILYVGMHESNGPAHESEVTRNGYVPGGEEWHASRFTMPGQVEGRQLEDKGHSIERLTPIAAAQTVK
jgi:hypothetical protein